MGVFAGSWRGCRYLVLFVGAWFTDRVKQVVLNPCESALWNLLSATSNIAEVDVLNVMANCDEVLPELAAKLIAQGKDCPAGSIEN